MPRRAGSQAHRQRPGTLAAMATLRMFASAREAAGTSRAEFAGATVGDVLAAAVASFGDGFARVLPSCRVWVNGEAADATEVLAKATSAIRRAANGGEVVDRIEEETGVRVDVISGQEEARLIFGAVRASVVLDPSPARPTWR